MGPFLPHVSVAASRAEVQRTSHSSHSGLVRSLLFGGSRLSGLCPQSFSGWHLFWSPRWSLGGNRLDGLCVPQNAFARGCVCPKYPVGSLVGLVAFTRHQLSRDRDSARCVLVCLFPGVYRG